jgi:hypothetical protein
MKFYSRKFVIVVLNYSIAAILAYFNKIDSLYFAVIILVTSICYLFIEGTIDFKAIKKLELDSIKYELKEEQNGDSTRNNEGA